MRKCGLDWGGDLFRRGGMRRPGLVRWDYGDGIDLIEIEIEEAHGNDQDDDADSRRGDLDALRRRAELGDGVLLLGGDERRSGCGGGLSGSRGHGGCNVLRGQAMGVTELHPGEPDAAEYKEDYDEEDDDGRNVVPTVGGTVVIESPD